MIEELDIVTLTRDLDAHGLTKGSRGAVVHCYKDGRGYEVEFADDLGESSNVLTLESSDIQLKRAVIQKQVVELLDSLSEDLLAEVRDFAEFLKQKQQRKVS